MAMSLPELADAGLIDSGWADALSPTSYQFYLGPPGSGAPLHFHSDAVSVTEP